MSSQFVGFWSKTFAQSAIRYRLPISIIKKTNAVLTKLLRFNRLAIELDGQADLLFDFKTAELRDRAIGLINTALEAQGSEAPPSSESSISSPIGSFGGSLTPTSTSSRDTKSSYVPHVPSRSATGIFSPLSRTLASSALTEHLPDNVRSMLPKAINLPRDMLQSKEAMHFVCLTIGSRGDVQPYIALALGLKKEGHRVTIVTHEEYKEWVVGFGIEHRIAGGDPGALMKLSVENKVTYQCPSRQTILTNNIQMFSPEFFKESLTNFRPWLDQRMSADSLVSAPTYLSSSPYRCLGAMSRRRCASGKPVGNGGRPCRRSTE